MFASLAALTLLLAAPEGPRLELAVGSPESSIRLHLRPLSALSLGAQAELTDAGALRLGLSSIWHLGFAPRLGLELEVSVLRSFATVDTTDLQLVPRVWFAIEADVRLFLRAGAIGYLGDEPYHRGVVGLLSSGGTFALSPALAVVVEGGAMLAHQGSRPRFALGLVWNP
ncbi:MAG: hypothetical protein U1E65_34120 [Myxococcota bacterium]